MPTAPPRSENRPEGDRIAKLLARAGVASRREVERMIAEGRVALDGKVLDTPATILPNLVGVTVDGNPVTAAEPTRLFAFHKPTGLITAERDLADRPTIYTALRNALPKGTPRLIPIGRLDLNTEGLLLLTNDGGLKRMLELPSSGVPRTYRARAFGEVSQSQLEDLIEGVEIDGVRYGAIDANLERGTGRNVWVEMTITEGKNREVRRVLEHLGLKVNRLIRVGYGPFNLGDLGRGQAVELIGKPVARFLSDITGVPIPRGGVKKAEKAEKAEKEKIAAPARPPRRGPPKPAGHAKPSSPAKPAAHAKPSVPAKPAFPRKGAADAAPARKGSGAPAGSRGRSRKHPPATRGNTPRGGR
jgi:pseudouridine synthase